MIAILFSCWNIHLVMTTLFATKAIHEAEGPIGPSDAIGMWFGAMAWPLLIILMVGHAFGMFLCWLSIRLWGPAKDRALITVIGKLEDTKEYTGKRGYNTYEQRNGYSAFHNKRWLRNAVERGDSFLILKTGKVSGCFKREVVWLIEFLQEWRLTDN